MEPEEMTVEAREELLRRAWYIHDAAWFAAVRQESGIETANRLNKQAVRAVGVMEARRLARAIGGDPAGSLAEVIDFMRIGHAVYVTPELMTLSMQPAGEDSYEVNVERCFVAEHIAKAGMAEVYECAVFDRVAAWHEAIGRPLAQGQLAPSRCAMANGGACRRVLQLAAAD